MRCMVILLLTLGCSGGCMAPKGGAPETSRPDGTVAEVVSDVGRIVKIHPELRFVVIEFSSGRLPEIGQVMDVYRENRKVATLRISGPHRNLFTVADIKSGSVRLGDEVR